MFVLICANKEGNIKIKSNELDKLIEGKKTNNPTIFENGIVLNWNMFAGVVESREDDEVYRELRKLGMKRDEAIKEVESYKGAFSHILVNKDKLLNQ